MKRATLSYIWGASDNNYNYKIEINKLREFAQHTNTKIWWKGG